ncbi:YitT family protein [Jeotgalibacillus sp. HH7-29]|uniref:YitT family protein n=2 Tax=Jeotgalibacillus haloalkalitolerans TaxID=3104292 RepID=A0ABU5KP12_9BACL|nr:YitT family protein [Jeotgalibacillus sp. HH7-29]
MAIVFGSLMLSAGINGFLVPHHLLDGGMIGLALIVHYYFGIQAGLAMILLSLPLFIYSWFKNRAYFFNSLHGLFVSSLLIDWLSPLRTFFQISILPSVLAGGLLIGFGIGLMLRFETSTGGTDLLAHIISRAVSINAGVVIFIVDGIVILLGYQVLGLHTFLYSCGVITIVGAVTAIIVHRKPDR